MTSVSERPSPANHSNQLVEVYAASSVSERPSPANHSGIRAAAIRDVVYLSGHPLPITAGRR